MLTWLVNVTEATATWLGVERAAADASRVMRRWGGYLSHAARKAAEEQSGWPSWAESTRRKYEQTRTSKVTAQGNVRESYAQNLARALRVRARQGVASAPADLAELARLRAGGAPRPGYQGGKAVQQLGRALERARTKGRRVGGDRRLVQRRKLLGRLPRMLVRTVARTAVTLTNPVDWSGVQNRGGTAGRGASIPARTWLDIDDQDRVVLVEIVQDSLLPGKGKGR